MVVLHYIPSIDQTSGGVGAYLKLLASALGKLVNLQIVTHRSENELVLENCTIHYIDRGVSKVHRAKHQYTNLLALIKPDIVHVNCCWDPMSSFTVFWAKSKGIPVIITPHGMLEPWVIAKNHWTKKVPALVFYQSRSLKMADCLIATAQSEKDNLLKLGYNKNVELVPNGIDIESVELKKSWAKTRTILYMGLLRPNKGAGILLDALSLIKDRLHTYKVYVAGPDVGGFLEELQTKCKLNGLDNIVEFTGGVYGEDKWTLYHNSDIFVLPTLNENFGIVIAESLLCGTPVVTCKGAPWSDIEKEECGWWVDRTPKDVANAIEKAISLPAEKLEFMGRKGNAYVRANFSSHQVAENMKTLYENVINSTGYQGGVILLLSAELYEFISAERYVSLSAELKRNLDGDLRLNSVYIPRTKTKTADIKAERRAA